MLTKSSNCPSIPNHKTETDGYLARAWVSLEIALQPIINTKSGEVYGFEALMRGHDTFGYESIQAVLEHANDLKIADKLYLLLLEKALHKLQQLNKEHDFKLFYNLDGRAIEQNPNLHIETNKLLRKYKFDPQNLILEFSETYNFTSAKFIAEMVRNLRSHGINFAIDDFGRGISELQLLYDFRPEIIKIDRYFVSGMVADHRKRLFVSTIVNLAHVLGIRVVIEGVETTEEFDLSWKLGGDLIQGYFIQPPSKDISLHKKEYEHISKLVKLRHEKVLNSHVIIEERVQEIKTLAINYQLNEVFETFRSSGNQDVFPVLNELGEPKGIICERDFKEFTYSPYGRELLKNKSYNKGLKDHIRKCPQLDKNTPVQEILDVHTYDQESSGIIITDNEKYYGFLSSEALIQISNDNRLNQALDQNPLSKLPGNITITKHIENCLQSDLKDHYFCYFDFDNFKPFNDIYGFREGDRAIILFADLLREVFRDSQNLIGHIGGDDFFASLPNYQANHLTRIMEELREKFSCNSECLYNSIDRTNRYIMAKDRIGRTRKFNLLSVSVGIVRVSKNQQISNSDSVFRNLAEAKKKAKFATTGVYISDYQDQPDTSFNNQENSAIQWLMTATNGFNERQAS